MEMGELFEALKINRHPISVLINNQSTFLATKHFWNRFHWPALNKNRDVGYIFKYLVFNLQRILKIILQQERKGERSRETVENHWKKNIVLCVEKKKIWKIWKHWKKKNKKEERSQTIWIELGGEVISTNWTHAIFNSGSLLLPLNHLNEPLLCLRQPIQLHLIQLPHRLVLLNSFFLCHSYKFYSIQ